ncbi:MAG TPA: 3-phosphoglycerate dehydrogenase [Candidatus Poseidoniales archaeon]|nr:MAG TPA: 3-phosphoglycerate dehydrogenase [Candidatus Poseidoniales archaeon]DAC42199.1 MAG TPA: 3-phosphoglycerate dehydrogenase [Candidatus Poseidoniales archaeon]HII26091.1 3-phosphoglycerate dehydrogenase [Candidatus Thalassarchaeaceae archaeon]HII28420.1 3-phosphoglycerate dehydrogenase [Candidatus Thalassarchaeaceae archaeon]|tara:strand:+ start:68 stop:1036 length:969 start_codon:yes stop_codon:yes gene_type:complete
MRIAVTDGIDLDAKKSLQELGHSVSEKHYSNEDLIDGCISEYDIVVIRSATKLTADVIKANSENYSKLSLIIRAGVGVDNIDLSSASEYSVLVCNTPSASTNAVVELTIGHLISSCRRISTGNKKMREGVWAKKELRGSELRGKNLGLLGYGRIARGVADIARSIGMKIHAYDPYIQSDQNDCVFHDSAESLFSSCTHISIHCFLSEETRHLVDYEMISLMPQIGVDGIQCGNHIVNCARGGIIDEEGLYRALTNGKLTTASLDVFEVEPAIKSNLLQLDSFQATPHIGASTNEAQSRIGQEIVSIVQSHSKGETPDSCLNK